jgi:hypothetical protein
MSTPSKVVFSRNPSSILGIALELPAPESVATDAIGNVTFTWAEYLTDLPFMFEGICATRLEQFRTNANTFVCLADAGVQSFLVGWEELRVFQEESQTPTISRQVLGVPVLVSKSIERRANGISCVVYRADAVYARVSGTVINGF